MRVVAQAGQVRRFLPGSSLVHRGTTLPEPPTLDMERHGKTGSESNHTGFIGRSPDFYRSTGLIFSTVVIVAHRATSDVVRLDLKTALLAGHSAANPSDLDLVMLTLNVFERKTIHSRHSHYII